MFIGLNKALMQEVHSGICPYTLITLLQTNLDRTKQINIYIRCDQQRGSAAITMYHATDAKDEKKQHVKLT